MEISGIGDRTQHMKIQGGKEASYLDCFAPGSPSTIFQRDRMHAGLSIGEVKIAGRNRLKKIQSAWNHCFMTRKCQVILHLDGILPNLLDPFGVRSFKEEFNAQD